MNIVMRTVEHWAHRLYPQFTFDDFLARLESLGSKKLVQVTSNMKVFIDNLLQLWA